MIELFLICAMSLPAANFTHPAVVSYHMAKSEEDQLKDFIKRNHDAEDVFITPRGQAKKLRKYGYERTPFTWRGLEVWIQRKPKNDRKVMEESA